MDYKEETKSSEYIYKGKVISLRKDEITLENGKESVREIIEHGGGSAILCVENEKVLLVNQFRYAYKENIWEIPAGKINKGELPDITAIRELEEECGLKAEKVKLLFNVYPSPGYTNEVIRIYQAFNFTKSKTNFDEDEYIVSKWFDIKEAIDMVNNGEIKDAKTIIALLYANSGINEI
ncbi:MAG: NUDIX hydrolase [Clostridia bacterium]|nr:NUDIX hydrolase [Clostridia bacterium]